jgi:hypothetical protein
MSSSTFAPSGVSAMLSVLLAANALNSLTTLRGGELGVLPGDDAGGDDAVVDRDGTAGYPPPR